MVMKRKRYQDRQRRMNQIGEFARANKTQIRPVTVIKLTPEEVAEMIRASK